MQKLLAQNRIILVHFEPGLGQIGEEIARMFVSSCYSAIYARGVERATPSCIFMDEFQDIADLGSSRFSDRRFLAMAREFKSAVVMLTQSYSGLSGATEAPADLEALVNNCNSQIMFHSVDAATQAAAQCYAEVDLAALAPRQAFVVRYESETGKHISSYETFNRAYGESQALLEKGRALEQPPEAPVRRERLKLAEIVDML